MLFAILEQSFPYCACACEIACSSRFQKSSVIDAGYIKVDRTAGLDMIYFIREIESTEVIEEYYRNY